MSCGYSPVILSAEILLWALLLQCVVGTGIGWLLARKEFWGKGFLDGLVTIPLIFPPIVIGYALLMALGRHGWLSSLVPELVRPNIVFTTTGLTIAGRTETLSLAIYNQVMDGQFDCANELSLLLALFAGLSFYVLRRYGAL